MAPGTSLGPLWSSSITLRTRTALRAFYILPTHASACGPRSVCARARTVASTAKQLTAKQPAPSPRPTNHLHPQTAEPSVLRQPSPAQQGVVFRQLFDDKSSTYTYLLADPGTREALLIDPVLEKVERDLKLVEELGLKLVLAINTHCHADHVTGTGEIKKRLPGVKSGISAASGAAADIHFQPGDTVTCGGINLAVLPTPGHTNGCVTYHGLGKAFTGDALLVRGCGRTDFQEGSAARLYDSVHQQIFSLPDDTAIYPAHDYKGFTSSTVAEEKRLNPRLTKSKADFVHLMDTLGLAYPKMIDVAVPANMACGLQI